MNIENIKILAEVAHKSKNFEQSYDLNTKLLEEDIGNSKAWIYKGIAAGWLSSPASSRVTECIECIKQGIKNNDEKELKDSISDQLIDIYENFIKNSNKELVEKATDFNKVTMPEGGSRLLHMATQTIQRNNSAKEQLQAKIDALDLLKLCINLNPSESNYSAAINAVNGLINHSEKNGNYLKEYNKINYENIISLKNDLLQSHAKLFSESNHQNQGNKSASTGPDANVISVVFCLIYYPIMYNIFKSMLGLHWLITTIVTFFGATIILFIGGFKYEVQQR
jgi:hypothetical protein